MLPKLSFVLGGASSGKSAFAENLVMHSGAPRVYIATSQAFDDEMTAKIDAHIQARGPDWHTIEAPIDAPAALAQVETGQVVLFDCATMWLSNQMLSQADIATETQSLVAALRSCKGRVVVVSNEVGMGVVPDNTLARQFRDAQGKLNQHLASIADLAIFVVAGQPLVLKGSL